MNRKIRKLVKLAPQHIRQLGTLVFMDISSTRNTVTLLSSGRSGSTWLASILQCLPQTRIIFEPFHPNKGIHELTAYRYTYVPVAANPPELSDTLKTVISGNRRSFWTEKLNRPGQFVYRRRLLKLVRANMLFPWLSTHFPKFHYVYLVRHPGAVILSQLQRGWQLSSRRLLNQGVPSEVMDLRVFDEFGWPDEGFLSNLIFWAIENKLALKYAQKIGALIVHYENLCVTPLTEIQRIAEFLDVKFSADIYDAIHQSSWSSDVSVASLSVNEKISKWSESVSEKELDMIGNVLAACGLNTIYGRGPMPTQAS